MVGSPQDDGKGRSGRGPLKVLDERGVVARLVLKNCRLRTGKAPEKLDDRPFHVFGLPVYDDNALGLDRPIIGAQLATLRILIAKISESPF
jgi:hypothetical protein